MEIRKHIDIIRQMERWKRFLIIYLPTYNIVMIGEKILGFLWEGEYNGLVELNLTDNSIIQIISLDEIKA